MFLNIVSLVYRSTLYWHFYGFRRLWWNHLCCLQVILNHIWNKLARSYYLLEWFAFEQVMTWRSTALLKSQNKMNIQEKKKKDGSAYSLQLHGSLSEFLVSFRPLWTATWFIFDYQEALCILIKTLDWVFIFRIVLDWSWVFFFLRAWLKLSCELIKQ